jgi:hypothetical protein
VLDAKPSSAFKSRVALTSDRSAYSMQWHEPSMPSHVNGYGGFTRANIAVGQTITMPTTISLTVGASL